MRKSAHHGIIALGLLAFGFLFWYAIVPAARDDHFSLAELRRMLREGASPAEQALGAAGVGERRDAESVPHLLAAMESESPLVRGNAAVAVRKILGADYDFNPDAAPPQRAAVIERYRQLWAAWNLKNQPAESPVAAGGGT